MLLHMLLLKMIGLANPVWYTAEQALGHRLGGSISIDPGATALVCAQWLLALAVMLLAAAVGVDRQRAEWVLFALVAGTALAAALLILQDLTGVGLISANSDSNARAQAGACAALGGIVAAAACTRTFERYETSHLHSGRDRRALLRTFLVCAIALVVCIIAVVLDSTRSVGFASLYGLAAFGVIIAVRRLGFGWWLYLALLGTTVAGLVIWIASSVRPGLSHIAVGFAPVSADLIATTERMLTDAPWVGTGAGTFGALLPIYRDVAARSLQPAAPTAAAAIALGLGWPVLWAAVLTLPFAVVTLVLGAFHRGRDSFYPAAGASALLLLLVLSFCDNGVLGTPAAICIAAITGLALVQRQSRSLA